MVVFGAPRNSVRPAVGSGRTDTARARKEKVNDKARRGQPLPAGVAWSPRNVIGCLWRDARRLGWNGCGLMGKELD